MLCYRVMGLISFLPHCNASDLMFEILKDDKIWGTICISIPYSKFWGSPFPCPPSFTPMIALTDPFSVLFFWYSYTWKTRQKACLVLSCLRFRSPSMLLFQLVAVPGWRRKVLAGKYWSVALYAPRLRFRDHDREPAGTFPVERWKHDMV